MKIDFTIPEDGNWHRYCVVCGIEDVEQINEGGIIKYRCNACGEVKERALYFDKHRYWIDKNNELWHESSGVFVRNKTGKYLFFKRNEYPFSLTIPSGHVDKRESAEQGAARELKEEVGITGVLQHLRTEDVVGDSCSSGADAHRWSAFLLEYDGPEEIRILEEGEAALWLSLDEAQKQGMVFVVDHMTKQCRSLLES